MESFAEEDRWREEANELEFSTSLAELGSPRRSLETDEFFDHLELMHFMAEDGEMSCFFSPKPQSDAAPYTAFLLDEPSWIEEKQEEEGSTGMDVSEDANASSLGESKLLLSAGWEEERRAPSSPRNARLERVSKTAAFQRCSAANSPALRRYTATFLFDSDEELLRAAEDAPLPQEEFGWLVGFLRARVFKRGKKRREVMRLLSADQSTLRSHAHVLRRHLCHQRPIHTLRSLFPLVVRHVYRQRPGPAPRLSQNDLTAKFCAAFVQQQGLAAEVRAALQSGELRREVLQNSKRLFLQKFSYMAYRTWLAGKFTTARLGLVAKEFDDGAAMLLRLIDPGSKP